MRHQLASILPAIGLTLGIAVVGMVVALQPRDGQPVAVVVAPWLGFEHAAAAIVQAGGRIRAASGLDWVVVADRGDSAFLTRLRDTEALFVIDAEAAKGCL